MSLPLLTPPYFCQQYSSTRKASKNLRCRQTVRSSENWENVSSSKDSVVKYTQSACGKPGDGRTSRVRIDLASPRVIKKIAFPAGDSRERDRSTSDYLENNFHRELNLPFRHGRLYQHTACRACQ